MANNKNLYDVVIIGQGASAFGAALYSARYQMKTLVIGDEFGGETATGSIIENYPGYSHIDGFDLMLAMKKQVEDLEVEIVTDKVKEIKNDGSCFIFNAYEGDTRARRSSWPWAGSAASWAFPTSQTCWGKASHTALPATPPSTADRWWQWSGQETRQSRDRCCWISTLLKCT